MEDQKRKKEKFFNKKKGFTMLEMIAAVIIIGILAMIIIPAIAKYLDSGKKKYYQSLEQELMVMAKDYYSENKQELPRGQFNNNGDPIYSTRVTTDYLKSENYITNDIVDTDGVPCSNSYVRVENKEGVYEYSPCLICKNYRTENTECSFDINGNDEKNPTCTIQLKTSDGKDYTAGVWTNKKVTATIYGQDNKGVAMFQHEKVKIPVNIGNDVKNVTGTYTLKTGNIPLNIYVYDKSGNRGECTTDNGENVKVDVDDPICSNIQVFSSGWQKKKNIQLEVSDALSGVKDVTMQETEITKTIENDKLIKVYSEDITKNGTYVATITDNADNQATCDILVDQIDTQKPVCTFTTLESIGEGENRTIKMICTDTESGVVSKELTTSDFISENQNGMITNVSAPTKLSNGYEYTITITGKNSGSYSFYLPNGKIFDEATNENEKITSQTINVTPAFTFTCPSTGYSGDVIRCNTDQVGVTMTCGGTVSLDTSTYQKTAISTASDKVKACVPTTSGNLVVSATKDGTTIEKTVKISEKPFTLSCPTSGYVGDTIKCTTNEVGVTLTCSGVSLDSYYNTSFVTTASDKTKSCIPTSAGTLKVTGVKSGVTITKTVTISNRPFTMSCNAAAIYTWNVAKCTVSTSGVTMTCGGNVSLSDNFAKSFVTTSSDMSKSCQPTEAGTLTVTATKNGYTKSQNISVSYASSSGGGSTGGGSSSSYTATYCQVHYAFGDVTTAYYNMCYSKTVSSCPKVYPTAQACASSGAASGDTCYTSCS